LDLPPAAHDSHLHGTDDWVGFRDALTHTWGNVRKYLQEWRGTLALRVLAREWARWYEGCSWTGMLNGLFTAVLP
jgi:hypothetical protein